MLQLLPRSRDARICIGRVGPLWLGRYEIPLASRFTHLYCLGASGQGKSRFLEHLLVQDIVAGRGVGLVDPHTDLARDTLAHLLSIGYFDRPDALKRVIYFDPTRTDYVIPFNILAAPYDPYTVAQHVIEAFRRTWPQALEEAPRFASIALHALLVLIKTNQSLIALAPLLTDRAFREQLLERADDAQAAAFFHDRYERWGREAPLMTESLMNKVDAFCLNPYLNHIPGATENRLDFRAIMDREQV